jgi:carbonic anhydrase/acetyltransferase-like protein (isoleucine patch superfamily)
VGTKGCDVIRTVLLSLIDRNWRAHIKLWRASGCRRGFVCRGNIHVAIAASASVPPPSQTCFVGVRLRGDADPGSDVTCVTADSGATLALEGVVIGRGARISAGQNAQLTVGASTYISEGTRVYASNCIHIGSRCAISWGVTIIDDDGHGIGLPPYSAPITIGDDVWIGCNATILKGVTIGSGSVVAAGAIVTRSCPPHSLIGGVPARILRQGVHWTDASRRGSAGNASETIVRPVAGGLAQ